jgi:hypothetical protein
VTGKIQQERLRGVTLGFWFSFGVTSAIAWEVMRSAKGCQRLLQPPG